MSRLRHERDERYATPRGYRIACGLFGIKNKLQAFLSRLRHERRAAPRGPPAPAGRGLALSRGEGGRDRWIVGQRDGQTDRQTDGQTDRQRQRQTDRQTDRDRQTDGQTETETDRREEKRREYRFSHSTGPPTRRGAVAAPRGGSAHSAVRVRELSRALQTMCHVFYFSWAARGFRSSSPTGTGRT